MNPFWESVRMTVCRKCIDGDNRGNCRLPEHEHCSLETNFSALLESLSKVKSHAFEAYVDVLHADICTKCTYQSADGSCKKRDTLECTLERYYPLIIEKVQSMKVFVD